MDPIFRRLTIVCILAMAMASGDCLQCYKCNSLNGKCEDEIPGTEQNCQSVIPEAKVPACSISEDTGEENYLARGCVDAENSEDLVCSAGCGGGGCEAECLCTTDLCNRNWDSAGGKPTPAPPTSTAVPTNGLKCYNCTSLHGKCEDEIPGTEQNCQSVIPEAKVPACSISEVKGAESYLARGCVDAEDSKGCSYGCGEGGCEAECLCTTDLCNKDWDTAGGKPTPAPPTSTAVPTNNLKCYVCSSEFGNCDETAQIGTETNCRDILPYAKVAACLITGATGDEPYFTRECADAESADSMTCSHGCSGGGCDTSCFCNTDLCNKNWDSAGWKTTPAPPTSTAKNSANPGHKPPTLILLTSFIIFLRSVIVFS